MPEREFVAFVRAVMVGRDGLHRDVLVDAFADSGATHVMSHISTGNVSFRAPKTSLGELGAAVEERLEAIVGHRTELFIRSVAELEATRNRDPFAGSPLTGDHERLVTFLLGPPPDDLALPITGSVVTSSCSPSVHGSCSAWQPSTMDAAAGRAA